RLALLFSSRRRHTRSSRDWSRRVPFRSEAFHRVVRAGLGKPEQLAAGIEEALITTIAGLCIAIPVMLIASHLNAKVRRIMHRIEIGRAARRGRGCVSEVGGGGETGRVEL